MIVTKMGKRLALSIGINNLDNFPDWSLSFAEADAQAVDAVLADNQRGGFVSSVMLSEKSTKARILEQVNNLLLDPDLRREDLVLIYFSGHGGLDDAGNLFLIARDTNSIQKIDSMAIDIATSVHIKELEISLDNTKAGTVIVLLDTCHSGASGKLLGRLKYRDRTNIVLIGASLSSQMAKEDPTLGHGMFTECLLRSFYEKPSYGEWITLQQILGFIQGELEKLNLEQAMEVSSHVIDSNILIARNPALALVSPSFTDTVRRHFELAGYDILGAPSDRPNLFIARLKIGFRPVRTGVLCLCNDLTRLNADHILEFRRLVEKLRKDNEVDNGILVTSRTIGQLTDSLPPTMTESMTIDELMRRLLDFSAYMSGLIEDFEVKDNERPSEPPVSKYFVRPQSETRSWKKGGKAVYWKGYAEELVANWISASGEQRLAILGDYGSGKSTLCKRIACELSRAYLTATDKRRQRIPILIHLRDFPRGHADLEALMINHLSRRCLIPNPNWFAFKAMNEAGLFVLIFDGFDEMAIRSHRDAVEKNLNEISKLASSPNSKVMLTSRPEYFFTESEEEEILEPTNILFHQRRYRRASLLPFGPDEIREFLRKRISLIEKPKYPWEYYHKKIEDIPGLSDLSQRPVLLEMVAKTLPALIEGNQPIDRPLLYRTYIEGEIKRQTIEKGRYVLLSLEDRFKLMQLLAKEFLDRKHTGLTASAIMELVRGHLSERQREELEGHLADFLTLSFLTREGDTYRFSHRTIMEYLGAKTVAEELVRGEFDLLEKAKLTEEVCGFLLEMHPPLQLLWNWVKLSRPGGYLNSNALMILHRAGNSFVKKDLSRAQFNDVRVAEINLVQANLYSTTLRNSDLRRARLGEANLGRADLTEAVLAEANLIGANLAEADLSGANLRNAQLSKADVSGANLQRVALDGAIMIDLKFDAETDVRGIKIDLPRALYIGQIDANFSQHVLTQNPEKAKTLKTRAWIGKEVILILQCANCRYLFYCMRWRPQVHPRMPRRMTHREIKESIKELVGRLPAQCPRCSKSVSEGKIDIKMDISPQQITYSA
jgi:hypothetical protein